MAALDPQVRIAVLERELEWASLTIQKRDAQIRLLEERLRQRRIQVLGPHSETLNCQQAVEHLSRELRCVPDVGHLEARHQHEGFRPVRSRVA